MTRDICVVDQYKHKAKIAIKKKIIRGFTYVFVGSTQEMFLKQSVGARNDCESKCLCFGNSHVPRDSLLLLINLTTKRQENATHFSIVPLLGSIR